MFLGWRRGWCEGFNWGSAWVELWLREMDFLLLHVRGYAGCNAGKEAYLGSTPVAAVEGDYCRVRSTDQTWTSVREYCFLMLAAVESVFRRNSTSTYVSGALFMKLFHPESSTLVLASWLSWTGGKETAANGLKNSCLQFTAMSTLEISGTANLHREPTQMAVYWA